jgi:hypothetical protein
MEGREQRTGRGEKEEEEECTAPADTNRMSLSVEEYLKNISRWLKVAQQTVAKDPRAAKTIRTVVNRNMEDALQTILQVQTEISEIKNNLTKEQGKSEGLQSALLMLKEDIRSTPTYASVARSPPQAQRTQRTYNGPKNTSSLYKAATRRSHLRM